MESKLFEYIQNRFFMGVEKELRKKNIDINAANKFGNTALIEAVYIGDYDIVCSLLQVSGIDTEYKNTDSKSTALLIASKLGHYSIVKKLIELGSNKFSKDSEGRTSLMISSSEGHLELVTYLLWSIYDNIQSMNSNEFMEMINNTESTFADDPKNCRKDYINCIDDNGFTALMHAVHKGKFDIVKELLNKGANPNIHDHLGNSPIIEASYQNYIEIVKILLKHESKINHKDRNGITALIEASQSGHEDIVKILLQNGAAINVQDKKQRTALDYAQQKKYETIVNMLRNHKN